MAKRNGGDVTPPGDSLEGRVSRIEGTLDGLVSSNHEIKSALNAIQATLAARTSVNWGWIIMGCGLIGGLYGAAIAPLKEEVTTLKHELAEHKVDVVTLQGQMATITERLESTRAAFADVRDNGSPITRERLRMIEQRLNIKGP